MNKSGIVARYFSAFLSAAVLASSVWAVWQRQWVSDWWRLRDYEPSAAIVKLSNDASLSEYGEKLFYVHDPQILQKEEFATNCSLTEETIVLGCYISNDKIFVFDVDDDRLNGVEQVTAAHETLHAAYDRLPSGEKKRINALLQLAYDDLANERLRRNIESYSERDASIVPNELHSILGTEVMDLPSELEEYYAQYFIDRSVVVTAAQSYEEEFTKRELQIEALDEQLEALSTRITDDQTQIELLAVAIDQERNQLNALRNSNPSAYNAGVPGFNSLISSYNIQAGSYRSLIDEYNDLVADRNAVALEERELIEAIDTRTQEL